jgi:parallel beta-helix repeat protein
MKTRVIGLVASMLMVLSVTALAAPPSHVCDKKPDHPHCASQYVDTTTTTTTTTTTVQSATTSTTQALSTTTTTTVPSTTTTTTPSGCSGVAVTPTTNLQTAFNTAGKNGTLCFAAGTYAITTVTRPLEGQTLISTVRRGAIITGNDTTQMWFNGEGAPNLEVRGFVIRNFNVGQTPGYAALKGARGFRVIDNEIAYNNGSGMYHAEDSYIAHNEFHHNSHVGFGGFKAHRTVIEFNEIYENGFNDWSDNSGTKHVGADGMVVRNNHYHHNHRNALWLDADHVNSIISGNTVEDNYGKGIHFEASCSGTISENTIRGNGDAGLLIVASSNTNVFGNTIADNRWDFEIWNQDRGAGQNCAWVLDNVQVYDNDITISQEDSRIRNCCGGGTDVYAFDTPRIRFDNNRYLIDGVALPFQHNWQFISAAEWVDRGQDQNSTFTFTQGLPSTSIGITPE